MPPGLTRSDYQALLNSISSIYTASNQQAEAALNQIRARAYWQIGERIVKVEQKNKLRADYGARLLENLSKDLTAKHGNGFSVTNLEYMRLFYSAFPQIPQTSGKLSWGAYQVLSTIKDSSEREKFTEQAVKKGWSVRELKNALKEEQVKREHLNARALSGPGGKDGDEGPAPTPKLKASPGQLYTYRLKFYPKGLLALPYPGDESREGEYLLDLGFSTHLKVEGLDLPFLKDQLIVERAERVERVERVPGKPAGKTEAAFKASTAGESALYTYRASLERVVDADTLKCVIELGLGVWTTQKLRLRGINSPELSTAKGQEAKRFVERELKWKALLIRTHKTDKWDRYLVDVWYGGTGDGAEGGKYLNQELLDKGLAEIYD